MFDSISNIILHSAASGYLWESLCKVVLWSRVWGNPSSGWVEGCRTERGYGTRKDRQETPSSVTVHHCLVDLKKCQIFETALFTVHGAFCSFGTSSWSSSIVGQEGRIYSLCLLPLVPTYSSPAIAPSRLHSSFICRLLENDQKYIDSGEVVL